jgi:glucose/arabinose dehydrogenase
VKRVLFAVLTATCTAFFALLVACGGDDTIVPIHDSGLDAIDATKDSPVDSGPDTYLPCGVRGDRLDASTDVVPPPATDFCGLPGSVVFTGDTVITIPSTKNAPDISWVNLPNGFCAHYYSNVDAARQIRVAPGGELFVASPSLSTAGGAPTGIGAIVVIPDDDKDGFGDVTASTGTGAPFVFQNESVITDGGLAAVQGMLFANGSFYYQDGTTIQRVPYTTGQRKIADAPTQMIDVKVYQSGSHWPKTLDIADDGTIYVTNGSDQAETCVTPHVFKGGILAIDGTPQGKQIAQGFRNPQYMKCQRGHDHCFVNELTRDFSTSIGGREKLVLFGAGQDWGFPCCATKNVPFPDIMPTPDCSGVQADTNAFIVGSTPFGLDFEPGTWPDPYKNAVFIAMHGQVGNWIGTRVVSIKVDTATGTPFPSSNATGTTQGPMTDFVTGFNDCGRREHGRATDLTFAPDGRMFIASDEDGMIFWVAPIGVKHP